MIIRTEKCDHCNAANEGAVVFLKGINTVQGYKTCTTGVLDHDGQQDYVGGGQVEFGGEMDEEVCGGCYKYQLGGEVRAGNITWKGAGEWKGASLCVQWDPTIRMDINCNINTDGTLEGCTEVCTCEDLSDASCEMKKWWNRFF